MDYKTKISFKVYLFSIFIVQIFCSGSAYCGETINNRENYSQLLEQANNELLANQDILGQHNRWHIIFAKFSILESQTNVNKAFEKAMSIEDPFYSSLALGGIASTEISSDINSSMNHYNLALEHALKITHWTNAHSTSLELLFQLLNQYPSKQAQDLLLNSKDTLDSWDNDPAKKYDSMFAFTKATVSITPSKAESLLYEDALKSYHYWESIEYLTAFLTQQQPDETLVKALEHYKAKRDWPNDRYYLQGVLIQIAKTDFSHAFEEMKKMRDMDNEIALAELAKSQLKLNQKENAQKIVDYLVAMNSEYNFTQSAIERLKKELNNVEIRTSDNTTFTEQEIDDFLQNPDMQKLRSFLDKSNFKFRNKEQAKVFIQKCLPLLEEYNKNGFGFVETGHTDIATLYGLLMTCSAAIGEPEQALEISKKINTPDLRINYLLDAYEYAFPMSETVSKWPLYPTKHFEISITE